MNNDIEKVQPFDSFSAVYKILGWAGFYKPLNNPASGVKRILHQIYRPVAFLIAVIFNMQHLIFIAQNRHDVDKLMDNLSIEIPQLNLVTKIATLYFQTSRIDRLNSFLKDDLTFRADDEEGQNILQKNKKDMHLLCRMLMMNINIAIIFWPASYFVRRYNNPDEIVPIYVPFATDTWAKFSLSVLIESGPILWTGYGHLAMDTLVSTYYSHAQAQVKIIKNQLENLTGKNENVFFNNRFQYRDLTDETLHERFVTIVKRYEKLVWYKNEIDSIFNFSLSFQFFSSASVVCTIIYKMTIVSVASFPFIFLIIMFCTLLVQVFLYCYFGNLLEFESRSVSTSMYNCDWLSLSPSFRRQMLIAMMRWSQPIQPRVCLVIPLSLNTFITIVKFSYTLYTVLVTTEISDNNN